MDFLANIGARLFAVLLDKLGAWFRIKKLEERASKAEALEKEKASIVEAANRARAEREALEAQVEGQRLASISDDAFLAGGR